MHPLALHEDEGQTEHLRGLIVETAALAHSGRRRITYVARQA